MKLASRIFLFFFFGIFLSGCMASSKDNILGSNESQVEMRQMQTRAFDTTDRQDMLRTVIATMQDLGFVIDRADNDLGTVSGTKLKGYNLRLTATARPRGETQTLVRVNATYNISPVKDPEVYQQFFTSLEKSLFLTAHQVD